MRNHVTIPPATTLLGELVMVLETAWPLFIALKAGLDIGRVANNVLEAIGAVATDAGCTPALNSIYPTGNCDPALSRLNWASPPAFLAKIEEFMQSLPMCYRSMIVLADLAQVITRDTFSVRYVYDDSDC